MSKVHEAARNFVQQYSALTEFAKALVDEGYNEEKNANLKTENGKLEQALRDKKAELDSTTAAVAHHSLQLNQVQRDISRKMTEADSKADLIIKDANLAAQDIIGRANKRAADIKIRTAAEQDEASKRIADLQGQFQTLTDDRDSLLAEINTLKQKFA